MTHDSADVMARCEYFEVCERTALEGHGGRCILHSNSEKTAEAFDRALEKHMEEYGADFRQMVFPGALLMKEANFMQGADFSGATFHGQAFFSRSTFGAQSSFRGAVFHEGIDAQDTVFTVSVDFSEARFLEAGFEIEGADFMGARFEKRVCFVRSVFCDTAHFTATFEGKVDLEGVVFKDYVQLGGDFRGEVRFLRTQFGGGVDFRGGRFGERPVFGRCTFSGDVYLGRLDSEE